MSSDEMKEMLKGLMLGMQQQQQSQQQLQQQMAQMQQIIFATAAAKSQSNNDASPVAAASSNNSSPAAEAPVATTPLTSGAMNTTTTSHNFGPGATNINHTTNIHLSVASRANQSTADADLSHASSASSASSASASSSSSSSSSSSHRPKNTQDTDPIVTAFRALLPSNYLSMKQTYKEEVVRRQNELRANGRATDSLDRQTEFEKAFRVKFNRPVVKLDFDFTSWDRRNQVNSI
jgi:hypothetical protein